jgi:hypothetical protein
MRKVIIWILVFVFVGAGGWLVLKWYRAQGQLGVDAFSLIPSDAIYCVATAEPISAWKEIANSETWKHLQRNEYFASLTSSANSLDSLIRQNDLLFDLIGSRALMVSAHITAPKEYDFLFLVDLKEVSGIKFINEYLSDFTTEGVTLRKEKYEDEDVIILYDPSDKSTLYIAQPGTYLLASFSKKIIYSALDTYVQKKKPISGTFADMATPGTSGMFQLYLNYSMLPEFMKCYSDGANEYVNRISQAMQTTVLNVSLEEEHIKASGHTQLNDSLESYIKTLALSGKGPTEFLEIAPQRTAFCMGLGFTSFAGFFENFQKNIQQDVAEYNDYRENLRQVESYLGISIQKNFINWVGDEVAIIELQSSGKGLDHETAVILKADNIEQARKDLEHVEKMIRRKTPVKFRTVDHRGYSINYLSMKGLFKVLLGKFFARYDKPYYTIVNNFVLFSNHPQTLESIIDDYLDKTTLLKSEEFRTFRKQFDDESAAFVYLNTPVLFNTLKKLTDQETRNSLETNKPYVVCFRHIGFQLVPETGGFKTLFVEQFIGPPQEPVALTTPDDPNAVDSLADENSVPVSEEEVSAEETDPMALPYIYPQNLNASSFTDYFPDSTVHFKVDLKNGFKDGSFTEHYPNGEVKMKGHFRGDKRDGMWRLYNENGKLILKRNYDDGEIRREKAKD